MDFTSMPPFHPALVHFPIALVTLSFIADLLGRFFNVGSLRSAGRWTLLAAAVTGIISVPLGYLDMNRATLAPETHEYVHLHLKVGWILLVCVAVLTVWRWALRKKPDRPIRPVSGAYLTVAFLVMALTLFQGWFGGEIVYAHGGGVAAAGQGTQTQTDAERPLESVKNVLARIPGFEESEHEHAKEKMKEPAGAAHQSEDKSHD